LPQVVLAVVTAAGTVLAMIVAWRRHGTLTKKAAVAVSFYAGVVVVAGYSACLAETAMPRVTSESPDYWARLPNLVLWLFSPVILAMILLMFRAWTWSAHDRTIHRGL
jgi:hypothetical protein